MENNLTIKFESTNPQRSSELKEIILLRKLNYRLTERARLQWNYKR